MFQPSQRPTSIISYFCVAMSIALCACSDGIAPAGQPIPGGPGTELSIIIEQPLPDSIVGTSPVVIRGYIAGARAEEVRQLNIGDVVVQTNGVAFQAQLDLPEGNHTIYAEALGYTANVSFRVDGQPPVINILSPEPGAFFDTSRPNTVVTGTVVDHVSGVDTLVVNERNIPVNANGRFRVNLTPTLGMNHINISATDRAGHSVTRNQSYIWGEFRPWVGSEPPRIIAGVSTEGLNIIDDALANAFNGDALEQLIMDGLGDEENVDVHAFQTSSVDIELSPGDGNLLAIVTISDLAMNLTYHYDVAGLSGDISGWVRANPVRVIAELELSQRVDGVLDGRIVNPQVELNDFRLDLDGILAIVEPLARDQIRDYVADELIEALQNVVFENITDANLLSRRLDILGREIQVDLILEGFDITPNGLSVNTAATISAPNPSRAGPGIFYTPEGRTPPPSGGHISTTFTDDFVNEIFAQSWRSGLLDLDIQRDLAHTGYALNLTTTSVAGLTDDGILQYFPHNNPILIYTEALLPPIVQLGPDNGGAVAVDFGDLILSLKAFSNEGQEREWARLALSGRVLLRPYIQNNRLDYEIETLVTVDLSAEPLFPIKDEDFEMFVGGLVSQIPGIIARNVLSEAFDLSALEALGVVITSARTETPGNIDGLLSLIVDLAVTRSP